MLTYDKCSEILGEDRVNFITQKLKSKNINQETTNRVLDYLACHKQVFPYLDNDLAMHNLVDNLQSSISYHGIIDTLKFGAGGLSIGFTNGSHVSISKSTIKLISPRKLIEKNIDSVIRHELDHIATSQVIKIDSVDQLEKIVNQNIKNSCQVFGYDMPDDIRSYAKKAFDNAQNSENGDSAYLYRQTGVDGKLTSPFHFGSTALNEGITDFKTHKMDEFANSDGYTMSTGYTKFETKITSHFAKTLGEEKLLKLQQKGDFVGITEGYEKAMGRDSKFMKEFYTEIEKPHSAPREMFDSFKNRISAGVREVWQNNNLQSRQMTGGQYARSFHE